METNLIMKSYKDATEFMQYILARWSQQFDNAPVFPFSFDVNREGFLCLSGNPICMVTDLDTSIEAVDADQFLIGTYSGDLFFFEVNWPFRSEIESIKVLRNGEVLFELFSQN